MRLLIAALIVINLALFGRLMGWLPGMVGDQPDAAPMRRQVNPERLKILPAPPAQQPASSPAQPASPAPAQPSLPPASPATRP